MHLRQFTYRYSELVLIFFRNIRILLAALAVLAACLFQLSCSTKKSKWGHRAYHTTTAYFNGYFNGEEALRDGVAALEAAHTDDYYRVLPVFQTGTVEASKSINPAADNAIKKASVVIRKHSIYIKGKEYNKYIDDAYLLIGKSHFYKRDYYAALEVFNYVAREPLKNNRRDPIAHVANSWLTRTYSELGMYGDARIALDRSLNDKTLPTRVKGLVYATLGDFYIKQANYPKAAEAMATASALTRKKQYKRRYLYIYGQLLQRTGDPKLAAEQYKKVLKMNPSYEMAFYARINLARTLQGEGGNSRAVRELLAKMLKDPKNVDFADQIYYALGEIEQREEQEDKAIEQYNRSIRVSTVNTNQKGLSHLAIADIYFGQREYRTSAAYYDSAVTFLSKEYPDYKIVENKRNSLADLVKKYETIALYDSLLRLSSLSEAALEKHIDVLIKRDQEEQQKQREKAAALLAEQNAGSSGPGSPMPGGGATMGNTGSWYFDNPPIITMGFTEFKKVWGDRPLEDNWRRRNKQSVLPAGSGGGTDDPDKPVAGVDSTEEKLSPADSMAAARKRYADAVPSTDEQKQAYTDSVTEAYYDLGIIYKERLQDLREAAEVFEEFLKRYPGSHSEATVFYQLYRIYLAMPDQSKADKYKNLILSKYPASEYARIISDPDFFKQEQLSKKEADHYYAETYRLYQAGQVSEALARCRTAETRYDGNPLMPKFALLKALVLGKMKDVNAFRSALQDVVKNYPADGVKEKAQELLDGLDKAQGIAPKDTAAVAAPLYTYKADTLHYYVVLFEDRSKNLNDFKITLSNFNNEFFSTKQLQISSKFLGAHYQAVVVQSFGNKKYADDYMKAIDDDDVVFAQEDMQLIDTFTISAGNYVKLMKEQKVQEYLDFFKRVYQ